VNSRLEIARVAGVTFWCRRAAITSTPTSGLPHCFVDALILNRAYKEHLFKEAEFLKKQSF